MLWSMIPPAIGSGGSRGQRRGRTFARIKSMRAAMIDRFGLPEVIRVARLPRPEPSAGQVLVHVRAAGVGEWDALIREHKSAVPQSLPLTLGSDISGVVDSCGAGVVKFHPGDKVYGVTNPD